MAEWFRSSIVDTGRLPLFCCFVGMIAGFVFIRSSTRMIRAGVRWWPGNVTPGGLHIHHAVFGVGMMLAGGIAGIAATGGGTGWRSAVAALFGVGAALVLDEFALILRLRDVYWTDQGRASIDAVFVALAVIGLLLVGVRPQALDDAVQTGTGGGAAAWIAAGVLTAIHAGLATVTLLKGKLWTGILGLFFPVLLLVGAIRLARPHAPWARWRYHRPGERAARRLARSRRREDRLRRPIARAATRLSELIAGRPDPD
ncbi:hypothetical protein [Dactylosporangium sp. CA-092794]|uniref:hypothetical protein n=1 Tax=Dactylosporangium sp. CA-092794 TaxID=3239929 RepID=UPI003D903B8B